MKSILERGAWAIPAGLLLSGCAGARVAHPGTAGVVALAPLPAPAAVAVAPRRLSFADAWTAGDGSVVPPSLLAGGADPAAPAPEGGGSGDLAARSSDPTEPLLTIGVNEWYSPGSHQLTGDDDWNQVVLRAVIPFKTGCLQHVMRVTQPFFTNTPSETTGIGDDTLFDLVVGKGRGFSYGIGADLTIPWGDDGLSSKKWSGGPAGVVFVPAGKAMFGALVQSYFSFAGDADAPDVAQVVFQPIAVLGLGGGRTVGLSELAFVYDFEKEDWTSLPFGLSVAQVVKIRCQATKFTLAADYNFVDKYASPDWTLRFGVSFLFP